MQRVAAMIFEIMSRYGINIAHQKDKDIEFLADIYLSKVFWEKIFIQLDKNDMTRLRCYLYDAVNYKALYSGIKESESERRVSPVREAFSII